jgi:hypothetical protein
MPELITETLLVTTAFKHDGVEYFRGDRVPVRHRAIRRIAAASPHLFAMEYETEDLDLEWLAALEVGAEAKYRTAKQAREAEKERQKRALREELNSQDQPQPELEKRFRKQEEEEEKRKQQVREEREREAVEEQIAIVGDDYRSGFNF